MVPPWADTPQADTPWVGTPQADTPPWADTPQNMVNEQAIRSYWNAFLAEA